MFIDQGESTGGLRWAKSGTWKIVAYKEGGYCQQQWVPPIGWVLLTDQREMPDEVERALCLALGIKYEA